MKFTQQYLYETMLVANKLNPEQIESCVDILSKTKENLGRLFIIGVGGSAANASHAVNDFRKICGIEAYAPTDNVAELTARTNDEGWQYVFSQWLAGSRITERDCVMVLSVGGGSPTTSQCLVLAVQYAKSFHVPVIGIVGRDGGETWKMADACILIPTVNDAHITPHAESFQAILWHLMVNHPSLK